MTLQAPSVATGLLFKGGPTLLDLMLDVSEYHITVTGPKMLFDKLHLLTSLSAYEGYTVYRLEELARNLEATIHCGLIGSEAVPVTVEVYRAGGIVAVDLGPSNMYQSELQLRTRSGETFRELLTRLLPADPSHPMMAALHPVPATGHLEHHHPPQGDQPDPQPNGTGHGHHHDHGDGGSHNGHS